MSAAPSSAEPYLRLQGLSKVYATRDGPVRALDQVSLSERRGAALDPTNFVILWEDARFGGLAKRIDGGRDYGHHGDALLNQKSA